MTTIALAVWATASASAQDAREPADDSPKFHERALSWFEPDRRPWRLLGAILVPGSGLAGGAALESPTSTLQPFGASVEGLISIHNYQELTFAAGLINTRRSLSALRALDSSATSSMETGDRDSRGLAIFLEHRYRRLPGLSLFGVDDEGLVRTDFGVRRNTTDLVLQWQHPQRWGIGMRAGVMNTAVFRGTDSARPDTVDRFGARLDAGRPGVSRYFTAGVGLLVDRRNNTSWERAGWRMLVTASRFASLTDEWPSFTRVAMDGRVYQPLFVHGHVLAVRLTAAADHADAGARVPYFLQQSLGGSSSLRGYSSYRFRGARVANLTVESRWEVHPRIELAPFLDVGQVGGAPIDQGAAGWLSSAGIAARFRHEGKTVGRVELAKGREGYRVVLAIGSAF